MLSCSTRFVDANALHCLTARTARVVASNGKRLSVENLAALTATSAKDIAPLLVELEQFHVSS